MGTAAQDTRERTAYRIKAMGVEACNCRHGCNCQFGGFPNDNKCEMILGYQIESGRFGDIDLAGVRVAVAAKYPNAIHEGHGHVVLFVDEKASQEQVDAVVGIFSGQNGGMPWEALAGTIERLEGPIIKPIDLKVDGQQAHVRIPGAIELETTPLLDPVTGAEKEVHIVYPKGGFFWNDGNVVTTRKMKVDFGDMKLEWPDRYASTAEVNWSNQN